MNQQVQYVSPTQGLITCSIQQVLEDLDLSTQGLQLIEREVTTTTTTNNNTKNADTSPSVIPLIKKIKIQEMLKAYNDELAEAKELELLTMGSKKPSKHWTTNYVPNRRNQARNKLWLNGQSAWMI